MSQNILIIGASRGIGLELVRQYRAAGHRVVATARSDASLQLLQSLGAVAHRLDVSTAEGCAAFAWPLDGERFDRVWLVAGVYGPRTQGLEPPTQSAFDEVMHTNVLAAMRLLPQIQSVLAPQARVGVLSSRMGSMGLRTSTAGWLYRASKAALNSVVKDASLVMSPQALVAVFHPGWVQTDMGGPGADIPVPRSAQDLRQSLETLPPSSNGGFFNHDGTPLAW